MVRIEKSFANMAVNVKITRLARSWRAIVINSQKHPRKVSALLVSLLNSDMVEFYTN